MVFGLRLHLRLVGWRVFVASYTYCVVFEIVMVATQP